MLLRAAERTVGGGQRRKVTVLAPSSRAALPSRTCSPPSHCLAAVKSKVPPERRSHDRSLRNLPATKQLGPRASRDESQPQPQGQLGPRFWRFPDLSPLAAGPRAEGRAAWGQPAGPGPSVSPWHTPEQQVRWPSDRAPSSPWGRQRWPGQGRGRAGRMPGRVQAGGLGWIAGLKPSPAGLCGNSLSSHRPGRGLGAGLSAGPAQRVSGPHWGQLGAVTALRSHASAFRTGGGRAGAGPLTLGWGPGVLMQAGGGARQSRSPHPVLHCVRQLRHCSWGHESG